MKDIDEVRRKAMALLEREAGGPVAAASKTNMSYSQWVNLRSGALDSKTGKPRGMRKETARRIEAAFERPEGWMDAADLIEDLEAPGDLENFALVMKAWEIADANARGVAIAWARATLAAHKEKAT